MKNKLISTHRLIIINLNNTLGFFQDNKNVVYSNRKHRQYTSCSELQTEHFCTSQQWEPQRCIIQNAGNTETIMTRESSLLN